MLDKEGYRPNVGIILANRNNQVFWGKRVRQHAWQFPQGGIQRGPRLLPGQATDIDRADHDARQDPSRVRLPEAGDRTEREEHTEQPTHDEADRDAAGSRDGKTAGDLRGL